MSTGSGKSKKIKKAVNIIKSVRLIVLLLTATVFLYAIISFISTRVKEEAKGDFFSRENDADTSILLPPVTLSVEAKERIEGTDPDKDKAILSVYKGMKEDNPDFSGFLMIEETNINYPVMYSKTEPERYLTKDINGLDSVSGLPFIDSRCSIDPESDNIIIYAHNMKNGSMFGNLDLYKDEEYLKEHPVIRYDSPEQIREYEIMSVFYDRVYYDDEDDYRFYDFIDAADEDDYEVNINEIIKKSIYDTGVRAKYGDKLITLVTCSYQTDNGRFVIIAKQRLPIE